ncbi:MAG: stage III sporulation protein AF [Peptococcaceae bacterium]|jgi:hypothetical protein|nr:stage III sporulation protein AF [Peptococcaceae bacterium]
MEMLGQITGQMAAFIILTFLFELMMPDEKWRRYLNVLTGLFMLLTLATPLRTLFFLYSELPESDVPVDSGILEEKMAAKEEDMRFFWDQSYEREIAAALKGRLDGLYGDAVKEVSVRVNGGEIQEVLIGIGEGADVKSVRAQVVQWLPVNVGQIKTVWEEAR